MTDTPPDNTVNRFKKELSKIGKTIRIARMMKGLTQQELAAQLGVSGKTVSAIEVGRVEPSISQIMAISACLNQPVGHFVGEVSSSIMARFDTVNDQLAEIKQLLPIEEPRPRW